MQSKRQMVLNLNERVFGLGMMGDLAWDSFILEKHVPANWLTKLYRKSILDQLWVLLSAPVD